MDPIGFAPLLPSGDKHFAYYITNERMTGYTTDAITVIDAINVKTFNFCCVTPSTVELGSSANLNYFK